MTSAIGALVYQARSSRRPRWSQQFLADELSRLGYAVTRDQVARLELSEPCRANVELVAAISIALDLDEEVSQAAFCSDYVSVQSALYARLPHVNRRTSNEIPTRVPQRASA
jgi:hypothetical protein